MEKNNKPFSPPVTPLVAPPVAVAPQRPPEPKVEVKKEVVVETKEVKEDDKHPSQYDNLIHFAAVELDGSVKMHIRK